MEREVITHMDDGVCVCAFAVLLSHARNVIIKVCVNGNASLLCVCVHPFQGHKIIFLLRLAREPNALIANNGPILFVTPGRNLARSQSLCFEESPARTCARQASKIDTVPTFCHTRTSHYYTGWLNGSSSHSFPHFLVGTERIERLITKASVSPPSLPSSSTRLCVCTKHTHENVPARLCIWAYA